MDFYDYDEYFCEPSEFDEKCGELIDMLRQHARKEIKDEVERLRAENASMKDIVDNYDQKVKELEAAKRAYEQKHRQMEREIECELMKKRLSELLSDFCSTLYCVNNVGKEKPKCDKCDASGYIHYKSPQGNDREEQCNCRTRTPYYVVEESECTEFKISTHYDKMHGKLVGWYRRKSDRDNDYYVASTYAPNHIYKGQDFSELDYYNALFQDAETAQKYADWLNERAEQK